MNRYEGQYNLNHVCDDLLVDKRTKNTFAAGNTVLLLIAMRKGAVSC